MHRIKLAQKAVRLRLLIGVAENNAPINTPDATRVHQSVAG
jgi:hypothetical protein